MKSTAAAAKGGHQKPNGRTDVFGPNSEIGRKLKQYFNELVPNDEVPDRFTDLLKQLDAREQTAPARKGE